MEDNITAFLTELQSPGPEFTPIPFWFLNDDLRQEELTRQLTDFHQKGVDGVVLHPRIGMPQSIPYLSDAYFGHIRHIVKTARDLGMRVVLYDEGMYPSGSAHGEVVKANPAFASLGLTLTKDRDGGKVIAAFDDGFALVQRHCGGTIRGIHFGEDDGESGAPPSTDILNPEAVDLFIRLTHDRYYEELAGYFGDTVIGFFTDEPCVLGRNAQGYREWTDGLEQALLAAGGSLPELRALFDGGENDTTRLYRRLVTERLNDVYYKKLHDWCQAHGIALMGHPAESGDIDEQIYFHIPGQDLVFRWVSPEMGGTVGKDSVQAKCSADAARHLGRRRNSNECFGVCARDGIPWYMTGGDMKWFLDWLGVRGVNLFIPHAFYYSVAGPRKDERPPDVGPNSIWWPHYRLFSDYMKRLSWLMTDSVNAAKIAVPCASGAMPWEEVAPFYENQIEFNYLPLSLLDRGEVRDGSLRIGEYEYTAFFSPDRELPLPRISGIRDVAERDLLTETPCPDLRATHLVKKGIHLYFLTNEGMAPIRTRASLPCGGTPLGFDLWSGELHALDWKRSGGRVSIPLSLEAYGSLLILFDPSGTVSPPAKPEINLRNDLLAGLRQVAHDPQAITKTYEADFQLNATAGDEGIRFRAEEMVECFCNGAFVGVSFWNPHQFRIGPFLRPGQNRVRLVVTGSIANRYSGRDIPYGITDPQAT